MVALSKKCYLNKKTYRLFLIFSIIPITNVNQVLMTCTKLIFKKCSIDTHRIRIHAFQQALTQTLRFLLSYFSA